MEELCAYLDSWHAACAELQQALCGPLHAGPPRESGHATGSGQQARKSKAGT